MRNVPLLTCTLKSTAIPRGLWHPLPRCYDLSQQDEAEQFAVDYKWTAAEAVVKRAAAAAEQRRLLLAAPRSGQPCGRSDADATPAAAAAAAAADAVTAATELAAGVSLTVLKDAVHVLLLRVRAQRYLRDFDAQSFGQKLAAQHQQQQGSSPGEAADAAASTGASDVTNSRSSSMWGVVGAAMRSMSGQETAGVPQSTNNKSESCQATGADADADGDGSTTCSSSSKEAHPHLGWTRPTSAALSNQQPDLSQQQWQQLLLSNRMGSANEATVAGSGLGSSTHTSSSGAATSKHYNTMYSSSSGDVGTSDEAADNQQGGSSTNGSSGGSSGNNSMCPGSTCMVGTDNGSSSGSTDDCTDLPEELVLPEELLDQLSFDQLLTAGRAALQLLQQMEPQTAINGDRNVWILKPGGKSRGRGIQLFDDMDALMGVVGEYITLYLL